MTKGLVFDVKHFAIHDGKGIRSTVFLKGCPLDCIWCQNPEGKLFERYLWHFERRCLSCKSCIKYCPEHALTFIPDAQDKITIDRTLCINCGECTRVCPTNALTYDSTWMNVDELVGEILKDRLFYEESEGGVTLSGGDPVFQHTFAVEVLERCKQEGLHTAVETCLYASESVVKEFVPVTDAFLVDMKLFDEEEHIRATGKSNNVIKNNLKLLADLHADMVVRIPLIPGYTANEDNLKKIADYVHGLRDDLPIELINFNNLARDKYAAMGKEYPLAKDLRPYAKESLNRFYEVVRRPKV